MTGRFSTVWVVARDPALRRIELSFTGFAIGEPATWLAILLYAFARGGVREAGLVAIVLLLGTVVVTPFAAYAGDRFPPARALAAGYMVQMLTMAAAAGGMVLEKPLIAYGAALVLTASQSFTRPVIGALLPTIARRPTELVGANVVLGVIANIGLFVGPLAAAGLLAVYEPMGVFWVFSAVMAISAALAFTVADDRSGLDRSAVVSTGALWAQVTGGLRALRSETTLTALILILGLGALTAGVMDVVVVTFTDVRLGGRDSTAAFLATAVGLGSVFGALAAAALVGGARLMPLLVGSGVVISAPVLLLSGVGRLWVTLALFTVVGMGQSLLAVTGSVAIQRRAPEQFLARIFGVLESIELLAMAIGAALSATLIDIIGLRSTMVVLGITILVTIVTAALWLVRLGGDLAPPASGLIDRLLADPVFSALGVAAIERLAMNVALVSFRSGAMVITEGEAGDRYYLVNSGDLSVLRSDTVVGSLHPGSSFGEIALLRDVPRTASIRCETDVELLAVDRDRFLEAVTGHPRSFAMATETADGRVEPKIP